MRQTIVWRIRMTAFLESLDRVLEGVLYLGDLLSYWETPMLMWAMTVRSGGA